MRYMLMMHVPSGQANYQIDQWTPADFEAHMRFMHDFNRRLRESGEFVDGQGLAPPGEAKLVRAGRDGRPVTDGPFAESKEFLAGFWIIDVESDARAVELAAEISAAPGPGGRPLHMPIEVRKVMSAPLTPE